MEQGRAASKYVFLSVFICLIRSCFTRSFFSLSVSFFSTFASLPFSFGVFSYHNPVYLEIYGCLGYFTVVVESLRFGSTKRSVVVVRTDRQIMPPLKEAVTV